MFRLLAGFLLVALAAAEAQVPADVAGFYGELRDEKPKPCCAASYFTFKSTHFLTYSLGEGISVEMQQASGAYDSIALKKASKTHLGFFNGTQEFYHTIDDYAEGKAYSISMFSGQLNCRVNELNKPFKKDCVPEDATYVGTNRLGDYALEVDSWYKVVKQPGEEIHRIETYQKDECVILYSTARFVNPETGVASATSNNHFADFKLGICESEEKEFFDIPEVCNEAADGDLEIPEELRRKIPQLNPTRGL